jgi:hypothetical protein
MMAFHNTMNGHLIHRSMTHKRMQPDQQTATRFAGR